MNSLTHWSQAICSTCCTTGVWSCDTNFGMNPQINPLAPCIIKHPSAVHLIRDSFYLRNVTKIKWSNTYILQDFLISYFIFNHLFPRYDNSPYLSLQTKLREGIVFRGVCLSTGGLCLWSHVPSGGHSDRDLPGQRPPWTETPLTEPPTYGK